MPEYDRDIIIRQIRHKVCLSAGHIYLHRKRSDCGSEDRDKEHGDALMPSSDGKAFDEHTKGVLFMKISKNSRLKTDEVLMLFGAMILSIKLLTDSAVTVSLQYTAVVIFAALAVADIVRAMRMKPTDKMEFIRYTGLAVIFLASGIVLALVDTLTMVRLMYVFYGISLIYSRVISIIKKRKVIVIIRDVIIILASMMLVLFPVAAVGDNEPLLFQGLILITLGVTVQTFVRLLGISMSQIRFDILKRIFIRSMAAEVFLGMLILIISFSLVLTSFEESIPTFGDALWYCFAIVTTIGFGDITASTGIGRVLSVVLGIYGIIVVALITSIIINFYSETKDVRMTDNESDEGEKQEQAENITEAPKSVNEHEE